MAFLLSIYSESKKVRQTNPAKVYLIDIGLARQMATDPDANRGQLLENLVYFHLRREGYKLNYIATSKGDEVDFYAEHSESGRTMLVQVAWQMSDDKTFHRETSALAFAGDNLRIAERYIVTWDEEAKLEGNISVVPVWKVMAGYAMNH